VNISVTVSIIFWFDTIALLKNKNIKNWYLVKVNTQ